MNAKKRAAKAPVLGHKIRQLMAERGTTIERLSRSLAAVGQAWSDTAVGNWVSGRAIPRLDVGAAIARILGVSLDYLAYDEATVPTPATLYPPTVAPQPPGKVRKLSPGRQPDGKSTTGDPKRRRRNPA